MRSRQGPSGLLVAVAFILVITDSRDCPGEEPKGDGRAATTDLKYGFRYDPMKWVETNTSAEAAQLRTFVLKKPQPGDAELLKKEIDKIFAKQKEDGSIGKDTHGSLARAIEFGCPLDRPGVKRAADFIAKSELDEHGALGIYRLRALCMSGRHHAELRDASLRILADRCKDGIRVGCPWSPSVHLKTLWAGRDFVDVREGMKTDLEWIANGMNEVGALSYKDPWGFLGLAATINHPLGKKIVLKLVPMLLRVQRPDGGWGDREARVLRALAKYDLLEPLRKLPPLPSDWTIVRSIPSPAVRGSCLTWDGSRLWVLNTPQKQAFAVSTEDGKVLKKLALPDGNIQGIAAWGKSLALSYPGNQERQPRVVFVDADTGKLQRELSLEGADCNPNGLAQVGDKLWIADVWNCAALMVDPSKTEQKPWHWVFPSATWLGYADLAGAGDGLWHVYTGTWRFCSAPLLIKSRRPMQQFHDWEKLPDVPNAKALEWGERPFDGQCAGIAWDGADLWAMNREKSRICLIRKADPAKPSYDWLDDAIRVDVAAYVPRGAFSGVTARMRLRNASVADAQLALSLRDHATYAMEPKQIKVDLPASSEKSVSFRLKPAGKGITERPPVVVSRQASFALRGATSYACEAESTHELLQQITVPRLGKLKNLDAVRDALVKVPPETVRAGDTAVAELRMGLAGDHLAVLLRSFDPRCRADAAEWKGCNVDVYLAKPGKRTVRQFVFFATSPKGESRLEAWEHGKKRETPEFPWRIVPRKPFGYEVHARIPLSECLLDPGVGQFLTDMAVVAPTEPGEKPKFSLLFTGPSSRCAFRNNRYYALAVVQEGD